MTERAEQWLMSVVGDAALIMYVDRLPGGTSSIVEIITLRFGDELECCVLRSFDNIEWLRQEPDLALHEARALERALETGIATPRLIAFDETGSECGMPSVLMSHLQGLVDLTPVDMSRWLDRLAEALARIHRVDPADFPWSYYTYIDIPTLQIPTWSSRPGEWSRALEIVKGPAPAAPVRFIHRDYHPTNVLWLNGEVSGIADWVNACTGPAGIDVGHCRVNLAQLYGVEAADEFLAAYRRHAGSAFEYDRYWDLLSLVDILEGPPGVYRGWTDFGVSGLSDELMVERLDRYLQSLVGN